MVLLVAIAKSVESISDVYFGLLQNRERLDRICKSQIIKGTLSLTAVTAILALTHSLAAALIGMIAVWLSVWTFYDRYAPLLFGRTARLDWNFDALKKLVTMSFPLGVTMLFLSLNASIPRLFLKHYGNDRQLGLFSALTALQAAGMMFIMAMGQAATTTLARDFARGDLPSFRKRVFQLQSVALGLGALTVLCSRGGGRSVGARRLPPRVRRSELHSALDRADGRGRIRRIDLWLCRHGEPAHQVPAVRLCGSLTLLRGELLDCRAAARGAGRRLRHVRRGHGRMYLVRGCLSAYGEPESERSIVLRMITDNHQVFETAPARAPPP